MSPPLSLVKRREGRKRKGVGKGDKMSDGKFM